jgi:glycine cleavage system aminomethyltransferase T
VTAFEFLEPTGSAVARSPMEGQALAAGARMELRDGWNVAVAYDDASPDAPVRWADVSHLTKLEIQRPGDLEPGLATRAHGAWWCRVTRDRALVIGDPAVREHVEDAVDVTSALAALTIAGPLARELFARFCALDLRPQSMPVRGFRPGSVARTPGYVLREDDDRFLMLFGWALGEYMWTVVSDAASALGGEPEAAHA